MSGLALESFEAALNDDGHGPDFNQGYAEGFAAGEAAAKADGAILDDRLVQNVADLSFTYLAARMQIFKSLEPLFDAIAERLLPHCVQTGFPKQIAHMLLQNADAALPPATLHLHPDTVSAVVAAVKDVPLDIKIATDPHLTPHAAWIGQAGQEVRIDMDRALADIKEILAAISTAEEESEHYG
ncbi:hypothetical protein [Yoonia sp. 2307UL14-13]|uniref:hypothetical protein n=1 Tax=Yoonia sp. 2307UL14-13 TaxID=3126506 RepID=UPI0030A8471D